MFYKKNYQDSSLANLGDQEASPRRTRDKALELKTIMGILLKCSPLQKRDQDRVKSMLTGQKVNVIACLMYSRENCMRKFNLD